MPDPTRELYDFAGWYLTQDFTGEAITGWNANEKIEDVTLYAKWTVKAENVVNAIKNLTERTHVICVVGEIDDSVIDHIRDALRSNKNAKVNLDLSGTTGLEDIPYMAFFWCSNLISIKFPDSICCVGPYSFSNCISLSKLELPESVTTIDRNAFSDCINLKNIEFSKNLTSIEDYAFSGCENLTNIKIPKSVDYIGNGVFYDCTSLTNIEFPESATSIEDETFYNCVNLTNIKIPKDIKHIGIRAFYNCKSLTNIELPETVTSIGSFAFVNCVSLISIELPKNITHIETYLFGNCTCLENIRIPVGVTSIKYPFWGCTSLSTITYLGTMEQWKSISIIPIGTISDEDSLKYIKIICTDGVINE